MIDYFTLLIAGVCVILFVLLIIALVKISKMNKRLNKLLDYGSEETIEELLSRYIERSEAISSDYDGIVSRLNDISGILKECVQKVGIIRYNPFDQVGGDLCFALALLDSNNNGVVLNGIFSREGSYTYAKPVEHGQSSYTLSEEEKTAISKAINK